MNMAHEVIVSWLSPRRQKVQTAKSTATPKRTVRSPHSSSGSSSEGTTSSGSGSSGESPLSCSDGEVEDEGGPDDLDEEWDFVPKVSISVHILTNDEPS